MSEIVRARPLSVAGSRRWRLAALALLLLGVAAAVLGWKICSRPAPAQPPALDPAGIDPKVWRAVETAREEVCRIPDSDRAWGRLGMVLLAHQFRDEAGVCLARAEQLNPKDVRWPYYQALAVRRSDPEAAIAHLRRAVALGGEIDTPSLMLAELLVQCGRRDEAKTLFQDVLGRNPANSRAHLGLARVAFEEDDLSASLAHLRFAQEDPRTRKAAHVFLAEVQQRRDKRSDAEAASRLAQRLSDDVPWPDPLAEAVQELVVGHLEVITHAATLLHRNDASQAIPLLQKAIEDYPESSWARVLLGRAWLRAGNLTAAEQALRSALRLAPDSVEAHFYLGVVLFGQGETEAALPCFRRATELKPDYALAWYNIGHCLKRRDDRAGALAAFRTAISCKPQLAEAHTNVGELLSEDGDGQLDAALKELQRAVQLAPEDDRARQLLQAVQKRIAMPKDESRKHERTKTRKNTSAGLFSSFRSFVFS